MLLRPSFLLAFFCFFVLTCSGKRSQIKRGECVYPNGIVYFGSTCDYDTDCPDDKKCCGNFWGKRTCKDPENDPDVRPPEKPTPDGTRTANPTKPRKAKPTKNTKPKPTTTKKPKPITTKRPRQSATKKPKRTTNKKTKRTTRRTLKVTTTIDPKITDLPRTTETTSEPATERFPPDMVCAGPKEFSNGKKCNHDRDCAGETACCEDARKGKACKPLVSITESPVEESTYFRELQCPGPFQFLNTEFCKTDADCPQKNKRNTKCCPHPRAGLICKPGL